MKKLFWSIFVSAILFFSNASAYAIVNEINTSTYDMVGDAMAKISDDKFIYVYREGTEHGAGAGSTIVGRFYTCTDSDCGDGTGSWGSAFTIYSAAGEDTDLASILRVPSGKIFVFFTRITSASGDMISLGYVTSTDEGVTWSSYTAVATPPFGVVTLAGQVLVSGAPISTGIPGEYMLWLHGNDASATNWENRIIHTDDYGETWDIDTVVYSGTNKSGEGSLAYLGDRKIIALVRNDAGGDLIKYSSSDNGVTWGAGVTTNIGGTVVNVPNIYTDPENGNLLVTYFNRQSPGALSYFTTTKQSAWTYTTGWPSGTDIDTGYQANGYQGVIRLSDTKIMVIWSKEKSSSDADLQWTLIDSGVANQKITIS